MLAYTNYNSVWVYTTDLQLTFSQNDYTVQ